MWRVPGQYKVLCLSQRGLAVQREIMLQPLAAQLLLLRPSNDSFPREVTETMITLLRPPPPREGLSRERNGLGQGWQAAEPREEPRVAPLRLCNHAALAVHRAPKHGGVRDVPREVGAMPLVIYRGQLRGRVPYQAKSAAELAQLQQRVEVLRGAQS